MVASNIAAPLLGLVDTAIIGHLADAIYLSAVALGAMVVGFIYLLAVFLRMSTTGLVAQAFGAQDIRAQAQVFTDAAFMAVILGALLLALSPFVLPLLWHLIDASAELQQLTARYIQIRFFGAPAALFTLVVFGVLLGIQQARQAMVLVLMMNLVNLLGSIVFILGLQLDVTGAALSTVIAEWLTAGLGFYFIRKHLDMKQVTGLGFSAKRLTSLLHLNRDLFIRSVLLHACMAMMTLWASYQGQIYVAANAVLLQFLTLISLGLDGIAYAAEALIGQAKGQKNEQAARVWLRVCLFWSTIFACVYALIFAVLGQYIIQLITNIPDVINTASVYLPWVIVLPLLAHWSYLFDGVFIAVSASKAMRNTMAIAALGVYLPLWWLSRDLGNHGLWLALSGFMLARGIGQAWVLKHQRLLQFNTLIPQFNK